MNTRTKMRHQCHVKRDMNIQQDAWNQPDVPDWQDHNVAQPCRAWVGSVKPVADGDKVTMLEVRKMVFPIGADIQVGDRIEKVTDRLGTTQIFPGPGLIDTLVRRPDHLAATLRDPS